MPVAFIQEFAATDDDRSTTNYDTIMKQIMPENDWPQGMIFHTAGWDEEARVFRIFDVWETQEDSQRFQDERLMPIMQGAGAPPDRSHYYEIHHLVKQ
jgi:hypothetical protein